VIRRTHLFFICILFFSCREKYTETQGQPHNSFSVHQGGILLNNPDTLFNAAELISLKEQNDSSFLTGIDKLSITNNSYLVLDKRFSQLHEYSKQGSFIRSFGSVGLAGDQYKKITDFDVSYNGKEVGILSNDDQAIYCYTASGKFTHKIGIPIFSYYFSYTREGQYLVFTNFNGAEGYDNSNVFLINRNGSVKASFFPYNPNHAKISLGFTGFLDRSDTSIYFAGPFRETIYQWDSQRQAFAPSIHVSINDPFTAAHQNASDSVYAMIMKQKDKLSFIGTKFVRNHTYTVFDFTDANRLKTAIYNNKTKRIFIIDRGISSNPLSLLFGSPVYLSESNELYFAESPQVLVNVADELKKQHAAQPDMWSRLFDSAPSKKNFCLLKVILK